MALSVSPGWTMYVSVGGPEGVGMGIGGTAGVGVGTGVGHGVASLAGTGKGGVGVARAAIVATEVTPDASVSVGECVISDVGVSLAERPQAVNKSMGNRSCSQRIPGGDLRASTSTSDYRSRLKSGILYR